MIDKQDNFIKIMKGSSANRSLNTLKIVLSLVQTACLLVKEGIDRISAGELVERLPKESNFNLTPSEAGQILIELGIEKSITRGKSRFILKQDQLKEVRQRISGQCNEQMNNLESLIKEYKTLPSQIQTLQQDWQKILQMDTRKKELIKAINENQGKVSNVGYLENQWKEIQAEGKRIATLEQEIKSLTTKIKELPSLEQKKASLEEAIRKYNAQESQLSQREASLGRSLQQFKERNAWVDLQTLVFNIQEKQSLLDQLSRQINEKRSFLDKLLHRNEGMER
jgi:DNA repair exonuclease SbcCD ATPase subunit